MEILVPVTGVDLWAAVIPTAAAFAVLIVLFFLGKKGKNKK